MRIDKAAEKSMAMDDVTWARHANPWSVYTRIPILACLAFAIWSRVWIGWWCLLPIIIIIAWTFYNPRAFPPPKSLDNWASKGVMGERIWLDRKAKPIPAHHARWAFWLMVGSSIGVMPLVWGLYALEPWAVVLGVLQVTLFKVWFVDRMVWLHEDQTPTK